jgi:hypothetical protein
LVPFVRALVPEVDLDAQTVRLADVPGLLTDLDDTPAEEIPATAGPADEAPAADPDAGDVRG